MKLSLKTSSNRSFRATNPLSLHLHYQFLHPENGYKSQGSHLDLHAPSISALLDSDIYDGLVHISKSAAGDTKTVAGNRVVPLLSPFPGFAKSQKRIATLLKPYGVTVHSLRKTYAYTLKSSQIHVTTAAKMMGHSNPLVTLKIYTLVLDDEIAKSASAIEAFMVKSALDNQAKKFAS